MPIGASSAPYVKFEKPGDRHGGEIVDFRVVQNRDVKTRMPLYLQAKDGGGVTKVNNAFDPDGRPNDPICQWEVTVETGVEDEHGDTERRLFIDPRKGRRGSTVQGKRAGDAVEVALKKARAHRVGLEIGARLFMTLQGKVLDGEMQTNTWTAEYEPPPGGPGSGTQVDEVPWLVGGGRYDKQAELAKWEAKEGGGVTTVPAPAAATLPASAPAAAIPGTGNHASSPVLNRPPARPSSFDDEPPF